MPADTILHSGKIATNATPSVVEAVAITSGKVSATIPVVVNADLIYAYNNLFASCTPSSTATKTASQSTGPSSYAKSLSKRASSCSSISSKSSGSGRSAGANRIISCAVLSASCKRFARFPSE